MTEIRSEHSIGPFLSVPLTERELTVQDVKVLWGDCLLKCTERELFQCEWQMQKNYLNHKMVLYEEVLKNRASDTSVGWFKWNFMEVDIFKDSEIIILFVCLNVMEFVRLLSWLLELVILKYVQG